MHSLDTILKMNKDAFERSIETARAAGKYVVAVYRGLALETYTAHRDPVEAQRRKESIERAERDTARVEILAPTDSRQLKLDLG